MECPFFVWFFYITWRIKRYSVFSGHWVCFLWMSDQWRRLWSDPLSSWASQKQGARLLCVGLLHFLCLQYGVSCYYTTASASPATTNIPTTTAVSATVKANVLVGNQSRKKYWNQRWNIYLINIVLQISFMGFVNMVCWCFESEICLLSTVPSPPTPPSICFLLSHLYHLTNSCLFFFWCVT